METQKTIVLLLMNVNHKEDRILKLFKEINKKKQLKKKTKEELLQKRDPMLLSQKQLQIQH